MIVPSPNQLAHPSLRAEDMQQRRQRLALRALTALAWAAFLVPPLLLAYACWSDYREVSQSVQQRIAGTLDVLEEQSKRVLQTTDRILYEAAGIVKPLRSRWSAEEERVAHQELAALQRAAPEIESIWAFDKLGHPLVSSTIFPVPRQLDNSERDYFKALVGKDAGTYVGENVAAKIGKFTFFVMSRRLPTPDGSFDGIVAITVPPSGLAKFYEKLWRSNGVAATLIRADGKVLSRFPVAPSGFVGAAASMAFSEAITRSPQSGEYEAKSAVDGADRQVAYRKVGDYPLYVSASYSREQWWRALIARAGRDLTFGLPAALLLIFMSVTALRRGRDLIAEYDKRQLAEQALKQAQRLEAVGQITGGVAHDFNNLLMVIQGNSERLKRHALTDVQAKAVTAITDAAQRGASLTRQLLAFSRRQALNPQAIELETKLPQFLEVLRASLRGDIQLQLEIQAGLWSVAADVAELELAMLNIAINARDAMPSGGVLTVGARNVFLPSADRDGLIGDFVELSFSDTGRGIPADVLPNVFEPFFTTKEVGQGTGLGLSQVYGFAQQSGGTVRISSEIDRGTQVSLLLPRNRANRAAEPTRTLEPAALRPLHILVVEDNAQIAEVTASNLRNKGHTVFAANNAEEALAYLANREKIDIVFSDIVMPGASGVELCGTIRQQYPSMPIVLATGYSDAAKEANLLGVTVLRKPYSIEEFLSAAQSALRHAPTNVVLLTAKPPRH